MRALNLIDGKNKRAKVSIMKTTIVTLEITVDGDPDELDDMIEDLVSDMVSDASCMDGVESVIVVEMKDKLKE